MKKRTLVIALSLVAALSLAACGKDKAEENEQPTEEASQPAAEVTVPAMVMQEAPAAAESPAQEESDTPPDGMVANPLTGEWIDASIADQRPIAAMVDDEKTALPHFGVSEADIIYEMTNSTANDGVTRFMVMVKDWGKIKQLGSIRSTRPTNLQTFPEWNAVLCHDGGPFYNDMFYANPYVDRFSGTFSRVNNGKPREFTEYIVSGDLEKNFKNNSKISTTYNEYYKGDHYQFATRSNPNTLDQYSSAQTVNKVSLPFDHNKPWLEYNADEGVYYYFQYGGKEVDAGNDNKQVFFKNLLIQGARLEQFDKNGYMMFHTNDFDYTGDYSDTREGWYITNGKAIKVSWKKAEDTAPTRYFDENGEEIKINVGKTYVAILSDKRFGDIKFE